MEAALNVICPYCKIKAELVNSVTVFGSDYGMLWVCSKCGARVGTHTNSPDHKPLGSLADAELRLLRAKLHTIFDLVWENKAPYLELSKKERRTLAYKWLAKKLDLRVNRCHIGMFNVAQCNRAIQICLIEIHIQE